LAINPTEVEKFLKGVKFPAKKEDLTRMAQQNGAPKEVIDLIKQLPGDTFQQPTDVVRAVSQIKR